MSLCNLCPRLPGAGTQAQEIKRGLAVPGRDLKTLAADEARKVGKIFQGEHRKKRTPIHKPRKYQNLRGKRILGPGWHGSVGRVSASTRKGHEFNSRSGAYTWVSG